MNNALTPDVILRDPDPDTDALTSAIAQHSDWLPQADYEVRGLMLADYAIERQIEKAGEQLRTLVDLYQAKIEALESHQAYVRRGIEAYIRMVNDGKKISWPDVGTAYISKTPTRIVIADEKETLAVLKREDMREAIKIKESIDKRTFDTIFNANPSLFAGCATETPPAEELRIRRVG